MNDLERARFEREAARPPVTVIDGIPQRYTTADWKVCPHISPPFVDSVTADEWWAMHVGSCPIAKEAKRRLVIRRVLVATSWFACGFGAATWIGLLRP